MGLDANAASYSALRLSNSKQKMLPDDCNRLAISKIWAVIEVLQLRSQSLEQIGVGALVH